MFGFTTIFSASVSLLLASQSVVAVPSPRDPRSLLLSIRQSSTDSDPVIAPECSKQCNQLDDTISNATDITSTCTNAIMSQFESCFDCEAKAGAATVQTLQDSVNSFVQTCADFDHPVNNVTVVPKNTNGGERLSLGVFGSVVVGLAALSLAAL
ncbi:hypothetical protein FB451DRAFT_1281980 [Mycena latifolia]|nr:hypothetical protein FB451DRAFT_1281980 [Mycena latifolia]